MDSDPQWAPLWSVLMNVQADAKRAADAKEQTAQLQKKALEHLVEYQAKKLELMEKVIDQQKPRALSPYDVCKFCGVTITEYKEKGEVLPWMCWKNKHGEMKVGCRRAECWDKGRDFTVE